MQILSSPFYLKVNVGIFQNKQRAFPQLQQNTCSADGDKFVVIRFTCIISIMQIRRCIKVDENKILKYAKFCHQRESAVECLCSSRCIQVNLYFTTTPMHQQPVSHQMCETRAGHQSLTLHFNFRKTVNFNTVSRGGLLV